MEGQVLSVTTTCCVRVAALNLGSMVGYAKFILDYFTSETRDQLCRELIKDIGEIYKVRVTRKEKNQILKLLFISNGSKVIPVKKLPLKVKSLITKLMKVGKYTRINMLPVIMRIIIDVSAVFAISKQAVTLCRSKKCSL